MKTKREVLKLFAEHEFCKGLDCTECPYNERGCSRYRGFGLNWRLAKIGAMAILRQNRNERKFDPSKVLTCVTADQAKVGMKGYFSDNLADLREEFAQKHIKTLTRILCEDCYARFKADNICCRVLFYPIDEEIAE